MGVSGLKRLEVMIIVEIYICYYFVIFVENVCMM